MRRHLLRLLGLEILVVVLVGALFASIPEKRLAGVIAGTLFVCLGGAAVGPGILDRSYRLMWSFWIGAAFTAAVAVPMLFMRVTNWNVAFEQLRWFGLSGPEHHRLANLFFILLAATTLRDLWKYYREKGLGDTASPRSKVS